MPPVVVPETGVVVLRSCHRGDASAAGAPGVIEVIDIHIVVVESRAAGSPHAPPHAARAEKAAERQKAERRASGKALSATAPRSTGWRAGSRRKETG